MKAIVKNWFNMFKVHFARLLILVFIVALGVAFYLGVGLSSRVLSDSVNAYDRQYQLADLTIYSNYGFSQEDIDAIEQKMDLNLYASYMLDEYGQSDGQTFVARLHSISLQPSFQIVEGHLPTNSSEILADDHGFTLGQTITLNQNNEHLKNHTFTIVGLVESPLYLSLKNPASSLHNQPIDHYFFALEDVFDLPYFTRIDLVDMHARNRYVQSYHQKMDQQKILLENLANTQQSVLADQLKQEAIDEYEQAKQKYDDGLYAFQQGQQTFFDQIADGQKQIDQAKSTLQQAKQQLALSKTQLQQKQIELDQQRKQKSQELADGQKEIDQQLQTLSQQSEQLMANNQSLEEGIDQWTSILSLLQAIQQSEQWIQQLQPLLDLPDQMPLSTLIQQDEGLAIVLQEKLKLNPDQTIADFKLIYPNIENQYLTLLTQKQEILTKLEKNELTIEEVQEQLDQFKKQQEQVTQGLAKIKEATQLIQNKQEELNQGKQQFNEQIQQAQQQIDQGFQTISNRQKEVEDGLIQVEHQQATLNQSKQEGEQTLANQQQELNTAKQKLDQADEEIRQLQKGEWTILDLKQHVSSVMFEGTIQQMQAIANVFPLFFLMVAMLVCSTSMTRMVQEERGEMGTLFALGYSKYQIVLKYLMFGIVASLIGSWMGILIAIHTFPFWIYDAWHLMYHLPQARLVIPWDFVVFVSLLFMGCIMVVIAYTCLREIHEQPAMLLRPKLRQEGKNIWIEKIPWIWQPLSFTWKVTMRNIFLYKKRFIFTILGIAGCSTLLLVGFGIKDSIATVVDQQFGKIIQYEGYITFDKNQKEVFANVNGQFAISYTYKQIQQQHEDYIHVIAFDQYEDLRSNYHFPNDQFGVLVSQKYAQLYGLKQGDTIVIESLDGQKEAFQITGLIPMYTQHTIILSTKQYEQAFHQKPYNTLYYHQPFDLDEPMRKHLQSQTIAQVEKQEFEQMLDGLNVIVAILIISSMGLTFLVLGNLIHINICERQRELATLKVLGFYPREVKHYIYHENTILTIFGGMIGWLSGTALHHYIMALVTLRNMQYGNAISLMSYGLTFGITFIFSFMICRIMAYQIHKIHMIESLKNVE